MILGCLSDRNFLILMTLAALASLGFAYYAQHVHHVHPCAMCYYERYVYWTVAAISFMGALSPSLRPIILWLLGGILVIGIGLGFYHLGVEKHWWSGPASCSGIPLAKSPEDFLKNLQSRPIARCDQVGWQIFGISATVLNLVWYSGFFCLWLLQRSMKVKSI